jgi:hypothetical protein
MSLWLLPLAQLLLLVRLLLMVTGAEMRKW